MKHEHEVNVNLPDEVRELREAAFAVASHMQDNKTKYMFGLGGLCLGLALSRVFNRPVNVNVNINYD